MDARWLVVLTLVAVPVAGCLEQVGLGPDEKVTQVKVDLEEAFQAEDTVDPDSPDVWAKTRDVSFQIGPDETDLTVRVDVEFEQDNPVPELPSGNVTVNLTDPGDSSEVWHIQRSGSRETTVDAPTTGTWNLVVMAQGDGSFTAVVRTLAPGS